MATSAPGTPGLSTAFIATALLSLCCTPPTAAPPLPTNPETLSQTGLYTDITSRTLAPGVFRFTPRYELWSDGAEKERFLFIPDGEQIDTADMDNWVFPVGTRAWKTFSRNGRLVETRLLWKQKEAREGWFQMAYVWNEGGTDAFARPDGEKDANGTPHDVPAQKGCRTCHRPVRDVLIGPSALQLTRSNGPAPLTGWAQRGLLSHPPASPPEVPGNEVVQAALGYMHANCGHCHRDGNALAEKRALRLDVKATDLQPEQTGAYRTTLEVDAWHHYEGTTKLVVPGDPEASQLFVRMQVRDAVNVNEAFGFQMPPTCTEETDEAGMAAIRAWIEQL